MTTSTFESMVMQMVAQGIPTEKAEATARRELGIAEQTDEKVENVLEREEQREVVKLFKAFGFEVYSLSQSRASKQSPGLPDLFCVHRTQAIAFWWETKRSQGGRYSDAQKTFRDHAIRCRFGYGCGDRRAAQTRLIELGLAHVVNGILEPVR